MTCKSGALTQDGSKSSLMLVSISVTSSKLTDASTLVEIKIKKDKLFVSTTDTMEQIKDGRFVMLILSKLKPRDLMKNLDSTLTDHSTLSLSFHSTELLRCTETPK